MPETDNPAKNTKTQNGKSAAITGLAGSAVAMHLAALPDRKTPYLLIADDADDAGYLYFDLCRFLSPDAVLYFPSGYKRDIKYGQIDPPNQILRAEALSAWSHSATLRWVVTYPEAIAEKVPMRDQLDADTLTLATGESIDPVNVAQRLTEMGFVRVDYVYEPGQYAVRGAIIDVFSFSHELPYRIDFFGDDIDSIRTFNIETQLSEQTVGAVSIVFANRDKEQQGSSLLRFIDDDTIIVCHHPDHVKARVAQIAGEQMSSHAVIAGEGDPDALRKVVSADEFAADLDRFFRVTYATQTTADDAKAAPAAASLAVHERPQGIYHKNFELISADFFRLLREGYKLFILSDSQKQIQRLKAIFADRDEDIPFEPVTRTLHEGFIDDDAKVCVFTDHQIFDRFHKYNLRSERARSGKLALSLRELSAIHVGDYIVHDDHGIGKFCGLLHTAVNGTPQEMIKLAYENGDIYVSIHALHKLSKYRGKDGVAPKLNKLGSGSWAKLKARTKSRLKDIARDLIRLYAQRREEKGFAFAPDDYLQHELEASFIYEDTPDQLLATQAVKHDMEQAQPMDRLICGDVGFGKTEIAIRAAFKAAVNGKQTAVLVPTTVLAFQHYNTFSERLRDFPVRVDYLSRARSPKDTKRLLADLADGKIDIIIGTHKLIGKSVRFHDLGLLVVDEEQKFGVAVKEKLKQLKVNVDTLTMSATPIPRTLQFSLMGARDLSTLATPPANRHPIVTAVNVLDDDIIRDAVSFELARDGQVFIVNNHIDGLYRLQHMVNRLIPDARVAVGHGQMPPEQLEQVILDFAHHDYDVLIATTIIENGIDMPNVNTIIVNNAHRFGLSELHQLRGRVGRGNRRAFCYLLVPTADEGLTPEARRRLSAIESFSDLGSGIHIAMQDLDIRGAGNLLGAEQSGFIADMGYEAYQRTLRQAVLELKTEEFPDLFSPSPLDENSTQTTQTNADSSQKNKKLVSGKSAEVCGSLREVKTPGDDPLDPRDLREVQEKFVEECAIDTDLELMLPADYVPQDSERINLYRELDSMSNDREVAAFEQRLRDRFGPIPEPAEQLIRIVPLRRYACRLGIEKIALRQGSMYLYFVGEQNVAYYRSDTFGRILQYLQTYPERCRLRQTAGKRSIVVSGVASVADALAILRAILSLPPLGGS